MQRVRAGSGWPDAAAGARRQDRRRHRRDAEGALAHYSKREWEEALAAFAEAYSLNPISTFLHDQADVLEHLRRFDEAAEMYERYLALEPRARDARKVRERIKRLREAPTAAPLKQPRRAGPRLLRLSAGRTPRKLTTGDGS